jgi:hypothetical protein
MDDATRRDGKQSRESNLENAGRRMVWMTRRDVMGSNLGNTDEAMVEYIRIMTASFLGSADRRLTGGWSGWHEVR